MEGDGESMNTSGHALSRFSSVPPTLSFLGPPPPPHPSSFAGLVADGVTHPIDTIRTRSAVLQSCCGVL